VSAQTTYGGRSREGLGRETGGWLESEEEILYMFKVSIYSNFSQFVQFAYTLISIYACTFALRGT